MSMASFTILSPKPPLHLSSKQNARCRLPKKTISSRPFLRIRADHDRSSPSTADGGKSNTEEGSAFSVVAAMKSAYNDIVVVDTDSSRYLLLDSSHNIHSMLSKQQMWTGSYWDDFACLPAIIPQGPIAILGLGGGTAAHLILKSWPSLQIEGWEIDEILIDMAREHFGLSDLEKSTHAGGSLSVHIGDALSPSVATEGGFAGIVVDLFSDGKILPQLEKDSTWLEIEKKLMPNGRIMVNCGSARAALSDSGDQTVNAKVSSKGSWLQNSTIKALCRVFPGRLSWKRMAEEESENYLALTGPLPDLDSWSASLNIPLSESVKYWKPCELAS